MRVTLQDGTVVASTNTETVFAVTTLVQWLSGVANTQTNIGALPYPRYIGLGTGSGTPQSADVTLFAEAYGTRKIITSQIIAPASGMIGSTLEMSVPYQTTDPTGTFTEAGLFDHPPTQLSLASSVSSGTATLPLSTNTVTWFVGEQIYISDGTSSEYISVASPAPNQGATSVPLASPLANAHASGTPVYVFVGNLWAHSMFPSPVTKGTSQLMTVTWNLGFS